MIPALYDYQNARQSAVNPSTIHVHNSAIARFFKRYLMQKAMAVFKWTVPKHWALDYFLYCLYFFGYVAVINTDKFGVIPQQCALSGYDVFYRPTTANIANPLLNGIKMPRIGVDCTLVRLQPTYCGIYDIVDYYGDLLALCAESAGVSLLNSHFAYVFLAKDNAQAQSYKKMYDMIAGGEPCVVVDKKLWENESRAPTFLTQDVKSNYITSDVLEDMAKIEAQFDTMIGISNANTSKKERMIVDEVNANNFATLARPALWLDQLQKSCAQTREMFDIDFDVEWRGVDNVRFDSVIV